MILLVNLDGEPPGLLGLFVNELKLRKACPMTDEWDAAMASQSLLGHEAPPLDFSFADASDQDRKRYGYPAEPDCQAQPQVWAKWNRNLARPWRRIVPEYDLRPARSTRRGAPTAPTSANWSGAVVPTSGTKAFCAIVASWVVPDAYPPTSDWTVNGWNDGYWNALHWIGMDGWSGAGANEVLQAGTGTDVNVQQGAVTVTCYAWFEWYYSVTHNGFIKMNNFSVSPGDIVTVSVIRPLTVGPGQPGSFTIANVQRHEYVQQLINPPSATLAYAGSTAEWIVEREGFSSGGYATLANYGAAFFSDCGALWDLKTSTELGSAQLVNMVDGSATVSTALRVSDTVLECYYGTSQP